MEHGEIDNLGGYKALLDISVKLNDKFKINDDNKGQVVVVETKYNDVCSYCQHEVARAPITKEEADTDAVAPTTPNTENFSRRR